MVVAPIILCGGSGARLWPASRPDRPKQFAPLLGPLSSFQMTVLRVAPLVGDGAVTVIAGVAHEAQMRAQLGALATPAHLLIEPAARDSAPAMAAAALAWAGQDPDAVLVFVSADHHIPDAEAFRASILEAAAAARDGLIVTLGVAPTHASTAYGYIQPRQVGPGIQRIKRFVEKPVARRARDFVARGYLWNSGNFVVSARTLLEELALWAPEVLTSAQTAFDTAARAGGEGQTHYLGPAFLGAPKISIDHAVMEKTARAAVLPVAFDWSDLGAWDAIWAASTRDAAGNVGAPGALLRNAANVLIRAEPGKRVAVVGAHDLAVVVEGDDVLVCDLAASQSVKAASDLMTARPRAPFVSLEAASLWLETWLTTQALPLWWALGADHDGGGYHEALGHDGRPVGGARRVRVQARQCVVYAWAGAHGWAGPWRQAAWHGLDFLLARYRRPDGLYRAALSPPGEPPDDAASLYDQTFVLLALASLHKMEPDRPDLAQAAAALRGPVEALRAPEGGFRELDSPFMLSNPHMHLLEAALAWAELAPEAWSGLADELAILAMDRLFDPALGVIRETYDAHWRPAPGEAGRAFWSGHQFEWAWLLERWGRWRGDDRARTVAARLFVSGSRSVDPTRGVAVGESWDDFTVLEPCARLWPQTERLKAALWMGDTDQALGAANALRTYLTAPVAGAWRERMKADGTFADEPAPASSFYHIAGALWDLRLWRSGGIPPSHEAP